MAEEILKEYTFDLSPLLDAKGYAVRCRTEDQASEFVGYIRKHHPHKARWWGDDSCWSMHEDETCYAMCYFDEYDGDDNPVFEECVLNYGSVESFEDEGFTILEFDDILSYPELDEAEAAKSVSGLFELLGAAS